MPSILLHLTAVERLRVDARPWVPELSRALAEDLEYARFGAALPDLPVLSGFRGGLAPFQSFKVPRFAHLFHERGPMALGLRMAELVSYGALVGREPGLAFLSGYFTHLFLRRALTEGAHRPGAAFAQALWYQSDFYGQVLVGESAFRSKVRVTKRGGFAGIGRGLYELLRVGTQATWGESPSKADVDAWVRGLQLYGWVMAGPIGRSRAARALRQFPRAEWYRNERLDTPGAIEGALQDARAALALLWQMVSRGRFTPRARDRFLQAYPERELTPCRE